MYRCRNVFSSEDGLLRNGQLIELICLWPRAIVHVRKGADPAFGGGAAERLILHLVVCNIAGRVVHRSGRWRYEKRMDAANRTVRRLSLVEKVRWRQLPLGRGRK